MFDPGKLPEKLKAGREYRGLSQQQMADKLDVHVTSYNKWEKGNNQLNAIVLAEIAGILNLSMDFFFNNDTPKTADLSYKQERDEIRLLADQINKLGTKVNPKSSNNPAVLAVEHNPLIERIVNRVRQLNDKAQQRIIDKIDGYIDALEEVEKGDNGAHQSA